MTTDNAEKKPLDLDAIARGLRHATRINARADWSLSYGSVLVDEVRRLRTENERLTRACVDGRTLDTLVNEAGISGEDRDPARIFAATLVELDRRTTNWQRVQCERDEREERVWALGGIIAGRAVPPTLAEVRAHEARGGDWLYQSPNCDIPDGMPFPEVWYIFATLDDELFARHIGHCGGKCGRVYEQLPEGRWWCWNNGPVAWPIVASASPQ